MVMVRAKIRFSLRIRSWGGWGIRLLGFGWGIRVSGRSGSMSSSHIITIATSEQCSNRSISRRRNSRGSG
jgi:hypothetical protein